MPESWLNPPEKLVFSNFCAIPICSHKAQVKNKLLPFFFLFVHLFVTPLLIALLVE